MNIGNRNNKDSRMITGIIVGTDPMCDLFSILVDILVDSWSFSNRCFYIPFY